MIKNFKIISLIILFGILFRINTVYAINNYIADTIISLPDVSSSFTISAGSSDDGIIINTNNIVVIISSGETFTINNLNGGLNVSPANSHVRINCDSNHIASVVISGNLSQTYTITPSPVLCVHSSGGGLPPAAYNLPKPPTGGFKVSINNGSNTTSNRIVTLNLNANSDVKKMAISLTPDFKDAIQEEYIANKQIDLCSKFGGLIKDAVCNPGIYTMYIKFYTQYGQSSDVYTKTITLQREPKALTVYNFGTKILKNGSKGEAVKELQRFLNKNLNLNLKIDGKLGPKTITVIKKWQKENDLKPDGLVGQKTKEKMNSLAQ